MSLNRSRVFLLLTFLVFCAYGNSLHNELLWDDDLLITDNAYIRNTGYFGPAFLTDLFHNYTVTVATHYRPMQTLSLMADYAIGGLNPFGYHLTNILWHLACVLMIAELFCRCSRSWPVALLGAAIFAVHPVNTNAIAYVAGRADPLALGFMLASLLLFDQYRQHRALSFFTASALAYVAALFSRENALLFPMLVLLWAAAVAPPTPRRWRDALLAALPYALLAGAFAFWRHVVLEAQGKPVVIEQALSVGARIPSFFAGLATYVGLLAWPAHLQMERRLGSPLLLLTVAGMACVIAYLLALLWARRRSRVVWLGLAWFGITVLPVSGAFSLNATVAEHWLYVPAIGLYLALAAVATTWGGRTPRAATVLCVAVVAALTARTVRRNQDWATPASLYIATKTAAPYSARVRVNLGQELKRTGQTNDALAELQMAEQVEPTYVRTKSNLAVLYQSTGKLAEARAKIEECLRLEPGNVIALLRAADIADEQNDPREADRYFVRAIGRTTDVAAWMQYGQFLLKHRRYREAWGIAEACRMIEPDNATVLNLLGAIHAEQQQWTEAETAFVRARALDRHAPDADLNLGRLACLRGDWTQAEARFQRARQLAPGDARPWYRLGYLAWQRGERPRAQEQLSAALQRAPGSAVIREALGKLERGETPDPSAACAAARSLE
jgi:Flp pilus assembly protein TadD